MTDVTDRRLSEAARRWQADQPPPPSVPVERLDEPLPRVLPWRPLAAAAAAVVLAAAGVVALTRGHGSDGLPPSTGTTTSQGSALSGPLVPWRDLPARHPRVGHGEHGRWVTAYDGILVAGAIGGRVHPGDTLVFTALVQSEHRIVLRPCPDFTVGFGRARVFSRQLNCAGVPYRDARGRPVLPAGTPVRFEIHVPVPDEHGLQKVLWTIDGPSPSPGFYGMVRVTPSA